MGCQFFCFGFSCLLPPHSEARLIEDFFREAALGAVEFCENGDDNHEKTGKGEDGQENDGWKICACGVGVAVEIDEINKTRSEDRGAREEQRCGGHEEPRWAIENKHRDHGRTGLPDVLGDGTEEAGIACLGVYPDINRTDAKSVVACLDEGLHAVGEFGIEKNAQAGFTREGPEAGWSIAYGCLGNEPQDGTATELQGFFDDPEFRVINDGAAADDEVGSTLDDGLYQQGDVGAAVLIVAIGVYDDIGPMCERVVHAHAEGGGETAVAAKTQDMVGAALLCYLYRAVGTAIVDDEVFDGAYAGDLTRKISKSLRQGISLVKAGDLDEEAHGRD
jgi:hypothetical protein